MYPSRNSTSSQSSASPSAGYNGGRYNSRPSSEANSELASRLRALSENSVARSDRSLARSSRSLGRSDPNQSNVGSQPDIGLKKKVGLVSGVSLIVGTMIGSGIFISPTGVAEGSGSVGLSLISWVICGIISLLGALCYAELGTMLPVSGAEYAYLLEAFGPLNKYVGPVPAFLFAWMNVIVLKPAQVAIISLAFAIYATEPFFEVCNASVAAQKCLAILCIIIITLVNCFSVRVATGLQNVLTVAKLVAIVIITFGGFVMMGLGNTEYLKTGFLGTEKNVGKIVIGLYNGMWAYDGWNNLNYVTEEIIDPSRNLPLALMIAIPLVTICYLLVNISYFSMMSVAEILESPAVAVTWGHRVLGVMAWIIPVSVACSTFGATNGTMFSSGRLTYGAAREGHTLEILSMVHIKRHTPSPSLIVTGLLAIIFIIPGDISSLIDFFSFAVWFFYGGTMVALIVMRWTHKDLPRPFKVPIVVPIFVLLISIFLVFAPIIDNPRLEFLYAFLFIVCGLIFYVPFVYFKKCPPHMDAITTFFQCLMEVSPPTDREDD